MKILCVFGQYAYGDPRRGEGYEYATFLPAFATLGHQTELFDTFDRRQYRDFGELNLRLIERINEFRPEIIFCVLMSYEVWLETLDLIRNNSSAAVVNWGTDDSWKFWQVSRYLAPYVDLHVTTHPPILQQARRLGLKNLMASQWAAAASRLAEPLPARDCIYDVSFVGAAYGNRRAQVEALSSRGIKVTCFGHGWKRGAVPLEEVDAIFRSSRISLNFADSGLQVQALRLVRNRQLKARTFEVPGSGGFLLTEDNELLCDYFQTGAEIVPYNGHNDLAEKIRYFLSHPNERDAIARAAHQRVRQEHTYEKRFIPILQRALEIVDARRDKAWTLSPEQLSASVRRYREGMVGRLAELIRPRARDSAPPGRLRRGLRRIAYEISWRLCGGRTFRAEGFPGRLFYRES